jgi:hypothetical protein
VRPSVLDYWGIKNCSASVKPSVLGLCHSFGLTTVYNLLKGRRLHVQELPNRL